MSISHYFIFFKVVALTVISFYVAVDKRKITESSNKILDIILLCIYPFDNQYSVIGNIG